MTRLTAIKTITANLALLREEDLTILLKVTSAWAQPNSTFRLTDAERAAIEKSRQDFDAGRTLTLDEAVARTDTFLAARRAARLG